VFQIVLGSGSCSHTTWKIKRPSVELLCPQIKIMATDLSRSESDNLKSVVYPMKIMMAVKLRQTIRPVNRARLVNKNKG
jgi:hypothetical protein